MHVKIAAGARDMLGHLTTHIQKANPWYWIAAPAQVALRQVLIVCRVCASLVSWEDAVQTSLVYAALVLSALLLAAFANSLALLLRVVLHLAGAYLPADVFARHQRLVGNEVLMVSGSDVHGTPITVRADDEGVISLHRRGLRSD